MLKPPLKAKERKKGGKKERKGKRHNKKRKEINLLIFQEFLLIAILQHLLAERQICILLALFFLKHNLINAVVQPLVTDSEHSSPPVPQDQWNPGSYNRKKLEHASNL